MLPLRPSTPAEKQEALDQVLASATFARSGQHRHFPQYVCELRFGIRGLPPVVGVEPCKPLIINGFGTPEWIRTTDLLLRRQLVNPHSSSKTPIKVPFLTCSKSTASQNFSFIAHSLPGGSFRRFCPPPPAPPPDPQGCPWRFDPAPRPP